jgi:hypothetical protein
MGMRIYKALLITTWLYSLLLWFYIVVRITVNRVPLLDRFIDAVPFLTFFSVGMISFALSFICLFIYLAIWGLPGEAKTK